MDPFRARVYDVVRRVPAGRVASYGQIAALAGSRRAARQVGRALHALTEDDDVPWWRIVAADGRVVIGHAALQKALLREEGVAFTADGLVDMAVCSWQGVKCQVTGDR